MHRQGMLDVETLHDLAERGDVDTVLCMFTDLQGRFMGKRVLPDFFLEEILGEEGLHACLYLLAIDMEMEPLPGYAYASWDTGYGDFRMVPDVSTLRWCPWLEKTAMVICDVNDEDDASKAVQRLAAPDPQGADRPRDRGRATDQDRHRSSSSTCSRIRTATSRPAAIGTSARPRRTSWTTTCCRPPATSG